MTEQKKLYFLIVDDDQDFVKLVTILLENAGHYVTTAISGDEALKHIKERLPDIIISDLVMPGIDGLELFQEIRKISTIKQPIFIIITAKAFEFDRRRAFQSGVDGYITKPINPETFVSELMEMIYNEIAIQFWGIRGTLPVPGEKTIRYGGNTNCVTLSFSKKYFFIFDAGTGIKALSDYLVKHNKTSLSGKIFITHPHYDHIHGFPFFVPLYIKGNDFEIYGASHFDVDMEKLIAGQMDSIYFPITTKEFAAKLIFHNLSEGSFDIDEIHIQTILLNHPGQCLGYRIQYKNKIFCYVTDNELHLESSPNYNQFEVDRLVHFLSDADAAVIDATYTDEEYLKKMNWGHSCVSRVVDVADKAKVKLLCLYHHDPDQTDNDIDLKLNYANTLIKSRQSTMRCIVPHEGETIII